MASLPFAAVQKRLASMVLGTARGKLRQPVQLNAGFAGHAGSAIDFVAGYERPHEINF
jgi:hypothetical protein